MTGKDAETNLNSSPIGIRETYPRAPKASHRIGRIRFARGGDNRRPSFSGTSPIPPCAAASEMGQIPGSPQKQKETRPRAEFQCGLGKLCRPGPPAAGIGFRRAALQVAAFFASRAGIHFASEVETNCPGPSALFRLRWRPDVAEALRPTGCRSPPHLGRLGLACPSEQQSQNEVAALFCIDLVAAYL